MSHLFSWPLTNIRNYVTIFFIATALLMQQVLYTRLFSVTLSYHYSFLVIALTMMGLTLGALLFHFTRARMLRSPNMVGYLTLMASLCTLVALYIQIHVKMLTQEGVVAVLSNALLLLPGFTLGGAAITLLLMRDMHITNRMYAVDLCGAAFGCILSLLLLDGTGVLNSLVITALLLMLAAWYAFVSSPFLKQVTCCFAVAVGTFAAIGFTLPDASLLQLKYVRGQTLSKPDFEAWNSYSQVVIPHSSNSTNWITIDQKAATPLHLWDGKNRETLSWLRGTLSNVAYHIRPIEKTLVIGVGGGIDILSALAFNTPSVTGIEMNRTNYNLVTDMYAPYSGFIHKQPGVLLINAEARSFLEQTTQQYDLIQISMIDTWAATAAGAFAMSENGLYTVDAWRTFLKKLSPHGVLSLTRWYIPDYHPSELYRMLSLVQTVLSQEGVERPQDHVAAVWQSGTVTLLVSKSPITPIEAATLEALPGKTLVLSPSYVTNPDMEMLLATPNNDHIAMRIKADLSPPTDDRPFFFNMVSLKQALYGNVKGLTDHINVFNQQAVYYLGAIFVAILICVATILTLTTYSAIRSAPGVPLSVHAGNITYFMMIGLGFMLVELALLQQLTLFLGYPSYALSVVLSVLLLTSGCGSFLKQKLSTTKQETLCLIFLFVILLAEALINPWFIAHARALDETVRVIVAVALLIPCGLFMGTAMPLGITYARMYNTEHLAPWLWGINGAASVLASVGGMCISIFFGIKATFLLGAACYAIVAYLYYRRGRKTNAMAAS